jgi:hypothetical protein
LKRESPPKKHFNNSLFAWRRAAEPENSLRDMQTTKNPMSDTLKTSLLVNEEETDCHIEFVYLPATRGSREAKTGLQLEPDEPASIEVLRVTRADTGEEVEKYDETAVEQAAFAYIESEKEAAEEIARNE